MVTVEGFKRKRLLDVKLPPQVNRPPAKLNLLTCQVKRNPEEKKNFDLFSRKLLSSCRHHIALV